MVEDRFTAIQEGDEAEILHQITENDLEAFAKLTGDCNPLHMDEAYASRTTLRRRVGHGMLTASFISTMIGTRLPGEGSLWYEQQLRFLRPARIGEKIRIWARVKHKSVGQRVVTLETHVYGEDAQKLIEGEAKVKMIEVNEKPSAPKAGTKKGAVIVTGASRGIGAAIARRLAADGFPVVVNCATNMAQAKEVAREVKSQKGIAAAFQADVSYPDAILKMVAFAKDEFGELAGAVNNASPVTELLEFSEIKWALIQRQIDVQIKGAFHLCKAILPEMIKRQNGVIVNIGSTVVDNVPPPKWLSYTVTKAALAAFSRCLAAEYGPSGIRVNCVSPGMTETDFITNIPEKAKLTTRMQTPLRRLATPEDIAGVVAFLFTDQSRHLTGQNIRVCGGIVMD